MVFGAADGIDASVAERRRVLRAGDIELDVDQGRVLVRGKPTELSPKLYALLRLFMSRPDRLLTKDDIINEVWDGRAVSDSVVTTAMKELRKALHDEPKDPTYIRTIYRRGYRFLQDVVAVDAEARAAPVAQAVSAARAEPAPPQTQARRRPLALLVSAASIAASAVVVLTNMTDISRIWSPASPGLGRQADEAPLPALPSDSYVVLVADLENDDARGTYTRAVFDATEYALEASSRDRNEEDFSETDDPANGGALWLDRLPREISIAPPATRAEIQAAENEARRWLAETGADFLIWGEVTPELESYTLRVTSARGSDLARYGFEDMRFGAPVLDTLAHFVAGAMLADAAQLDERSANGALFAAVAARLKPLAEAPPQAFDRDDVRRLRLAYAEIAVEHAEASAGRPLLLEVVELLEQERAETSRDEVPIAWATVQASLSKALSSLGVQGGDADALRRSIATGRAALEVFTRDADPKRWASLQQTLGWSLYDLGKRDDIERISEAITAFEAAGEVWTREAFPKQWTSLQRDLGQAYNRQGTRTGDDAILEKALEAYRGALEIVSREEAPKEWAYLHIDMGNTLNHLGAQGRAIGAYRKALEVLTAENEPLDWAGVQMNLGVALADMGEKFSDPNLVRNGIDAYQASLSVTDREKRPLDWASIHHQIGHSFVILARLGDPSVLTDAVKHYDFALLETPKTEASFYWAETQSQRSDALIRIAERTGDAALVEEALANLETCLPIFEGQSEAHLERARARLERGRAFLARL